jgi:hypothetical protein
LGAGQPTGDLSGGGAERAGQCGGALGVKDGCPRGEQNVDGGDDDQDDAENVADVIKVGLACR